MERFQSSNRRGSPSVGLYLGCGAQRDVGSDWAPVGVVGAAWSSGWPWSGLGLSGSCSCGAPE
eukprot:10471792-Prorocentrum_lima.AAC.1